MARRFIDYRTDPALLQWAADILGLQGFSPNARVVAHLLQNDDGTIVPLGVVVLDRWTDYSCEASIASDGSTRWASRGFIQAVYKYVFEHAQKLRMTMAVSERNAASIATQVKLGHVVEGRLRDGFGEGHDGILFGFTKQDFLASKWHTKLDQLEKGICRKETLQHHQTT